AADPVRAALVGDFLHRRIPGICRAFPAGGSVRRRRATFRYQCFRNPHYVRRGMAVLVVQAFCRQEHVPDKGHRRQRRYGGRGGMKSDSGAVLGLLVLAGLLTAAPARAEDAPESCQVPDYLLASEGALPKVAEAIKSGHSLDILVIGSRSATISPNPNIS